MGILLKSLTHTRDISVSEDPKTAGKKTVLLAVSLDELILEEANNALRDCQAFRHRIGPIQNTALFLFNPARIDNAESTICVCPFSPVSYRDALIAHEWQTGIGAIP